MKYLVVLFAILFIAGCSTQAPANTSGSIPSMDSTTKQGDTTLTGKVTKSGDKFFLIDATGKQTEIDSYKIELSEYVDKQVSITGQYSGDTLFAAKVE